MLCATQQQLQRRLCSQAVKPRTTVTVVRAMADGTKVSAQVSCVWLSAQLKHRSL